MKIQAPAKLNLTLDVIRKRPDGYHLLESDVLFLNLCDELEFETSEHLEINSNIEDNIVVKAARALSDKGVRITLKKNIPIGAGLGGGSADAAATLYALNKLWHLNLPEEKLFEIALSLGADVPVCLLGHLRKTSAAHFSGIGEIVKAAKQKQQYYLLVNPHKHLLTRDVFNNLNGRDDLEQSAIELVPEIREILMLLRASGKNVYARMTGSGATCFAVFDKMQDAQNVAAILPAKYWKFIARQHSY